MQDCHTVLATAGVAVTAAGSGSSGSGSSGPVPPATANAVSAQSTALRHDRRRRPRPHRVRVRQRPCQCLQLHRSVRRRLASRAGAVAATGLAVRRQRRTRHDGPVDGRHQLTVAGHPVYTFSGESAAGQTKGRASPSTGGCGPSCPRRVHRMRAPPAQRPLPARATDDHSAGPVASARLAGRARKVARDRDCGAGRERRLCSIRRRQAVRHRSRRKHHAGFAI
jgi:hypothetical protein